MTAWSRRGFIASVGTLAGAFAGGTVQAASTAAGREAALLRTYVAGTNRPEVRRKVHDLRRGAPLRLLREPDNDYDARAVSVWAVDGTRLGYVPRIDNQALANLMDAGLALRARVGGVRADPLRPELRVEINLVLA